MFQILCIRKRETVSYMQYINVLDFVYQKGGTVSYLQYINVLDFAYQKGGTVSYLHYVYGLDCVYQKEGNSFIPTIYVCSRFCVSERGKLYHTYNMFMS